MFIQFCFLWLLFQQKIYSSFAAQFSNIQKVFLLDKVDISPHAKHISKRSINSYSSFDLIFPLPYHYQKTECPSSMKKYVKLILEPNLDLLNDNSFLQIHNEFGEVIQSEKIDRKHYKIYRGLAFITYLQDGKELFEKNWYEAGWARILLHKSEDKPVFEGSFMLFGELYSVNILENYMILKEYDEPSILGPSGSMVIWRESDFSTKEIQKRNKFYENNMCMFSKLPYNIKKLSSPDFSTLFDSKNDKISEQNEMSRAQLLKTIGDISGCPKHKRIAYVGVVADCNYASLFNTTQNATSHILLLYNKVSAIYETTFNISIGVSNVVIMNKICPTILIRDALWNRRCSLSYSITDRLEHFTIWKNKKDDNTALWSLFTTCRTTVDVGIAWLSVLCKNNAVKSRKLGSISGSNVIASPMNIEHIVLAHEIAHGFGAFHDCDKETCRDTSTLCCPYNSQSCDANDNYIMSSKSSVSSQVFSPCTIGQVCSNIGKKRVNLDCFYGNKNITLISKQMCGNGIVEEGEDCDCGGIRGCEGNLCCDPKTCKYTSGSVCDDSNEECCKNCKFAQKGTTCRPSRGICDIAELCPGDSAVCPPDKIREDGISCGNGLRCASGICTSRDQQCKEQFDSEGACYNSCIFLCKVKKSCVYSGLQNYFIDGTPCGYKGFCYKGNCKEDFSNQLKMFFMKPQNWIFIALFISLFLIAYLIYCLFKQYFSNRIQKRKDFNYATNNHLSYINYPDYAYMGSMPNYMPSYMPNAQFESYQNNYNLNQRNDS